MKWTDAAQRVYRFCLYQYISLYVICQAFQILIVDYKDYHTQLGVIRWHIGSLYLANEKWEEDYKMCLNCMGWVFGDVVLPVSSHLFFFVLSQLF